MEGMIDSLSGWLSGGEALRLDLLGRLLLAAVLGGLIGLEREVHDKPAGLRTNLLICVGATLLTDLSIHFAEFTVNEQVRADPARITAQIVSGIGFLGAGTIIQSRGSVTGLTTAATLWVVAAIGMAVGSGAHIEAVGTAVLVLVALAPLNWLEHRVARSRSEHYLAVKIETMSRNEAARWLGVRVQELGGTPKIRNIEGRSEGPVEVTVDVQASSETFNAIREHLLDQERVVGVRVERFR